MKHVLSVVYLLTVIISLALGFFALYATGENERMIAELYGERFWRLGALGLAVGLGLFGNIAFMYSSFEEE
ncbi:hypothetical protein E4H12_01855 [Candidatus Thorarchaeota archaeon]|nr:MAG: hypothetical protein E4H12_01855 [Candidatus Thorarchaeota archaeon]